MTTFAVQWHITGQCGNRCKHCYLGKRHKGLPFEAMCGIVDSLANMKSDLGCELRIDLTGGDPLLHPGFYGLLEYIGQKIPDCNIGILGNPELLDDGVIDDLKSRGVVSYQISVDGLEATHDRIRYSGSFQRSINAIKRLVKKGMDTAVMSTVSLMNIDEIPSVADLAYMLEVTNYGFNRFTPIGNGASIADQASISPTRYRDFLIEMDRHYEQHKGGLTHFGANEPLWYLLKYEQGQLQLANDGLVHDGCPIGVASFIILDDGGVLACRRVPIIIGNILQTDPTNIFIESKALTKLREYDKIKKCGKCNLLRYCRGCRASAYCVTGNYFGPDPQCWL